MAHKLLLLADDEILIQRLLQPHLQRAGYETIIADNGSQAVELATRERPHVIVLDIMMPEVDGFEALRQLKGMEATKSIPVMIITCKHDQLTKKEAFDCGAAGFLTKPFSPAQLLAEIKRILPVNSDPSLN